MNLIELKNVTLGYENHIVLKNIVNKVNVLEINQS